MEPLPQFVRLRCKRLYLLIVTHRFEEPGAGDTVVQIEKVPATLPLIF